MEKLKVISNFKAHHHISRKNLRQNTNFHKNRTNIKDASPKQYNTHTPGPIQCLAMAPLLEKQKQKQKRNKSITMMRGKSPQSKQNTMRSFNFLNSVYGVFQLKNSQKKLFSRRKKVAIFLPVIIAQKKFYNMSIILMLQQI